MRPRTESRPTNFSTIHVSCDSEGQLAVGGQVIRAKAGAALLVGDVVYFTSTANTVNKSTTVTNYTAFAGVVVGGKATDFRALHDDTMVGQSAAASAEDVLVQIDGVAWGIAGATISTIGSQLMASAVTAGRLAAGTTAGQMIGTQLSAGTAGVATKFLIDHR